MHRDFREVRIYLLSVGSFDGSPYSRTKVRRQINHNIASAVSRVESAWSPDKTTKRAKIPPEPVSARAEGIPFNSILPDPVSARTNPLASQYGYCRRQFPLRSGQYVIYINIPAAGYDLEIAPALLHLYVASARFKHSATARPRATPHRHRP